MTNGRPGCPGIWELSNGDVAVIGRDLTRNYLDELPTGVTSESPGNPSGRRFQRYEKVGNNSSSWKFERQQTFREPDDDSWLDEALAQFQAANSVEDAINFHRTAVAILREPDEPWLLAVALDNLATGLASTDAMAEAERRWGEALELLSRFADPRAIRIRARIEHRRAG